MRDLSYRKKTFLILIVQVIINYAGILWIVFLEPFKNGVV